MHLQVHFRQRTLDCLNRAPNVATVASFSVQWWSECFSRYWIFYEINIVSSISKDTSSQNHPQIVMLTNSRGALQWDHECKTVALRDAVPNKPKYCNWPEGVPPWLIGGVSAQWSQFHVSLASCKPRLDLCSDGEVFSTYGRSCLLTVSAFLSVEAKSREPPMHLLRQYINTFCH